MSDGLKEELTAHVSVAFMSLIGMAIYSSSYSATMAMGISTRTVPVLEMWIVFSHLACSISCIAIQITLVGIFNASGGVPRLGESQVSIFLGIACAATCASADCLSGTAVSCTSYFPAAANTSVSSVCCIIWVWIMYLTSLGTVFPVQSFSLGITNAGGVTASTVMAILPPLVSSRLVSTCGSTMCAQDCGLAGVIVAGTFAMLLAHVGASIEEEKARASTVLKWCGVVVACLNGGVILPYPLASSSYRLTSSILALLTCIPSRQPPKEETQPSAQATTAMTKTTTTAGRMKAY